MMIGNDQMPKTAKPSKISQTDQQQNHKDDVSETMHSQVSDQQDQLQRRIIVVCDACGKFIEYWGFKAIHGRVWAYLVLSKSAVSQVEMAQHLGVSKGLISMAIADLMQYGLVKASEEHHHTPYEANLDVWPIIADVLRQREWMLLESTKIALEGALESAEIAQQAGEDIPFRIERIRLLLQMTQWAQSVLKLMISAKLPSYGEKISNWFDKASHFTQKLKSILNVSES